MASQHAIADLEHEVAAVHHDLASGCWSERRLDDLRLDALQGQARRMLAHARSQEDEARVARVLRLADAAYAQARMQRQLRMHARAA